MAFDGEMPTAPLVVGGILLAPVLIPGVALWGAFHGVKAIVTHGLIPGMKKIAAASKKF